MAALDYDGDGWLDLFVANDGIEFYLYHNERNGTFKEWAFHAGIALMADGAAMAAMCISFADYDNDGQMDLYVSDFQDVPDHVWRNQGKGFFEEVTDRLGIANTTSTSLGSAMSFNSAVSTAWPANAGIAAGMRPMASITCCKRCKGWRTRTSSASSTATSNPPISF